VDRLGIKTYSITLAQPGTEKTQTFFVDARSKDEALFVARGRLSMMERPPQKKPPFTRQELKEIMEGARLPPGVRAMERSK